MTLKENKSQKTKAEITNKPDASILYTTEAEEEST